MPASVIVSEYGAYTREQFNAARKREGGVLPVVIPCHNEQEHLPSTLLALARTGNVLPVVVDNRSTDETAAIATKMGAATLQQPTGRKMAATQKGIAYIRDELRAKEALFTDGDTLPLSTWPDAMEREFNAADKDKGVAVFGGIVGKFGASRLADLGISGLSQLYKVMHSQRGALPVAYGANYGLRFDEDGALEAAVMSLHPDAFMDRDSEPEDLQLRNAVSAAGAAVVGTYNPDTWVITNNDRIESIREIIDIALGRSTTTIDRLTDSYLTQYGSLNTFCSVE